MRTVIIKVDSKEAEYIERLDYERGFTKDVLQRIIESHMEDPDVINRLIRNRERNWMHSSAWQ